MRRAVLVEQLIKGSVFGSELVRRERKQNALEGKERMRVVRIPMEDRGSGFSEASEGLMFFDELVRWQGVNGFGSFSDGLGEVKLSSSVGEIESVFVVVGEFLGLGEIFFRDVRV
jgi:hypothetical protein